MTKSKTEEDASFLFVYAQYTTQTVTNCQGLEDLFQSLRTSFVKIIKINIKSVIKLIIIIIKIIKSLSKYPRIHDEKSEKPRKSSILDVFVGPRRCDGHALGYEKPRK